MQLQPPEPLNQHHRPSPPFLGVVIKFQKWKVCGFIPTSRRTDEQRTKRKEKNKQEEGMRVRRRVLAQRGLLAAATMVVVVVCMGMVLSERGFVAAQDLACRDLYPSMYCCAEPDINTVTHQPQDCSRNNTVLVNCFARNGVECNGQVGTSSPVPFNNSVPCDGLYYPAQNVSFRQVSGLYLCACMCVRADVSFCRLCSSAPSDPPLCVLAAGIRSESASLWTKKTFTTWTRPWHCLCSLGCLGSTASTWGILPLGWQR